jgi:hypothetical protein
MSTPNDNPGNYEFPFQQQIPGLEDDGPSASDMVAKARVAANVAETVNKMSEGTDALLQTLSAQMESLKGTVEALPSAFASTADHIKRGADAAEKLADASNRVAQANERGARASENQRFSIKDTLSALSHGNIQGAIAEAFQGLPGRDALMGRANSRLNRLGEGSLIDRLMGRGTFAAAEGEAATAAPGLLARLGIAGGAAGFAAAAGLWSPAAVYGMYRLGQQVNAQQQADLRVGQLTGEGRGAGIAAMGINIPLLGTIGGEAGALRGSPFDLVGNKEAREIVAGVRGQGFRGDEARGLEESIRGVVNDLGLSVQDAVALGVAAKRVGMSTQELTTVMSTLDDTAKNAHASVGDLAKAVQGLITENAQFSRDAAMRSTAQLQNLERQFQGTQIARSPQQLAGFLQGTQREMVAQLNGFAPYEAHSRAFNANFNTFFTRTLVNLARAKPEGLDWQAYVSAMMLDPTWQQLFGQTPIPMIGDLLRKAWRGSDHGQNVEGYVNRQRSANMTARVNRVESSIDSIASAFQKSTGRTGARQMSQNMQSAEFALVGDVDRSLISQGYDEKARGFIEKNLRAAVRDGSSKSIDTALKELGDRIENVTKNMKVHSVVTVDPRYGRMLRTINTPAIEAARGQRSKQGTFDYTP